MRRRLRSAPATSPRLLNREQNIRKVAGADAPVQFGEEIMARLGPLSETCAAWGLLENSAFMRMTVAGVSDACLSRRSAGLPPLSFLTDQLLGWSGWEQAAFKDHLGRWILSRHAAELDELREGPKRLAFATLQDPRLPRNDNNWQGVAKEAKDEFVRWLSRDDIVFFFEHVLPRGSDPHRRKDFWLRYVRAVRRSRPLLNREDRDRLRTIQRGNLGSWATMV